MLPRLSVSKVNLGWDEGEDSIKIVQRNLNHNKNYAGNSVTGIAHFKSNGSWEFNKVASSTTKLRPFVFNGERFPNPFETRSRSIYDYQELPNFNNPRFFELLTLEFKSVIPAYLSQIKRSGVRVTKKRLSDIESFCRSLSVNIYPQAVEVLRMMSEIKVIGPDDVERRLYNPEHVLILMDKCDVAGCFGEDPLSYHRIQFNASWFRTSGEEKNSRPYPADVTWDDIERAIKNGF